MDTRKWTDQLDQTTDDFSKTFGSLSHEQLNWKPNPGTWSIAQNMDHLIAVNRSYFPILEAIRTGTYDPPFLAKFGFIVNFFGNFVLKAVQPHRQNKMKTFALWEPEQSEIGADIVRKFVEHQRDVRQLIERSSDLLDSGIIISSPANSMIVYKLETTFDIMVIHEQRHFNQASELLKSLPAPH